MERHKLKSQRFGEAEAARLRDRETEGRKDEETEGTKGGMDEFASKHEALVKVMRLLRPLLQACTRNWHPFV